MLAKFITFAALLATVTAATAVSQSNPTSQDTLTSQTSGRSRTIGRKHTRKPQATGGPQTSPAAAQAGGTPEKCTVGTLMCCMNIVDPNGFGAKSELAAVPVFPTHEFYGGMGVECNFVTADSVGWYALPFC